MPRRVTMQDVARHVGLSKAAVSMVLNDHPGSRVSLEAADRIRAAARELDYRPNLTARSLSTQKSNVIGFVSEYLTTDRSGGGLVRGALAEARRHGKLLFIAETREDSVAAEEAIDALIDHQVDGLIYAATRPRLLQLPARAFSVPHIILNAVASESRTILPDEYQGAREIVEVLVGAGHDSDVVIVGRRRDEPEDVWFSVAIERRMAGIADALSAHHVETIAEVTCQPWSLESGYDVMANLLRDGVRPKSVICLNDRLAFGVYRALEEAGFRVPTDVSVVSFDDDDIALYLKPTLTTAAIPAEEMGALAVRLLLDEDQQLGEFLVPMPVRRRGSVGQLQSAQEAPEFTR